MVKNGSVKLVREQVMPKNGLVVRYYYDFLRSIRQGVRRDLTCDFVQIVKNYDVKVYSSSVSNKMGNYLHGGAINSDFRRLGDKKIDCVVSDTNVGIMVIREAKPNCRVTPVIKKDFIVFIRHLEANCNTQKDFNVSEMRVEVDFIEIEGKETTILLKHGEVMSVASLERFTELVHASGVFYAISYVNHIKNCQVDLFVSVGEAVNLKRVLL